MGTLDQNYEDERVDKCDLVEVSLTIWTGERICAKK